MNKKLTPQKCRELITALTDSQPVSIKEGFYLEALMIAMVELEKRERIIELAKRVWQRGWYNET